MLPVIHLHTSEAAAVRSEPTSGHVDLPEDARSQGKTKLLPSFSPQLSHNLEITEGGYCDQRARTSIPPILLSIPETPF